VVQTLLSAGVDVNLIGGDYGTALQEASRIGNDHIVQALLMAGADVNLIGGTYGTALQAASSLCHQSIIRTLLEAGADVNSVGGYYNTALQAASWRRNEYTVQILLTAGADVNLVGGEFGTALQAASGAGSLKVVEALLASGADVNAIGGRYGTALEAASRFWRPDIVERLLEAGTSVSHIEQICGPDTSTSPSQSHDYDVEQHNGVQTVQLLLDAGATVNRPGERFSFVLEDAVYHGWTQIENLLRHHGAKTRRDRTKVWRRQLLAVLLTSGKSRSTWIKRRVEGFGCVWVKRPVKDRNSSTRVFYILWQPNAHGAKGEHMNEDGVRFKILWFVWKCGGTQKRH
jgi:ankyrin repeat protein